MVWSRSGYSWSEPATPPYTIACSCSLLNFCQKMPGSVFLQVANQPPASQQQGKIMAAEVDFSGPLCRKGSLVPCSLFSILYWLALDYCWNTAALHAFVSFYKIPTLLGILHLALKRANLMKLKLYFANTRLVSGCTAWLFRYQKKRMSLFLSGSLFIWFAC